MSDIPNKFNIFANTEREKQRQSYNLTPKEQQEIYDIRRQEEKLDQQEVQDFQNPEIYNTRWQNEIEKLIENPELVNVLPPPGLDSMPEHCLVNIAAENILADHQARRKNFSRDADTAENTILQLAAEDDRGPKPEQESQQDQALTQEFNQKNQNYDHDR